MKVCEGSAWSTSPVRTHGQLSPRVVPWFLKCSAVCADSNRSFLHPSTLRFHVTGKRRGPTENPKHTPSVLSVFHFVFVLFFCTINKVKAKR